MKRIYTVYIQNKLVHKLFAVTLVVVMASILFFSFFFYLLTSRYALENSKRQLMETVRQTNKYISDRLELSLSLFHSIELDRQCKEVFASIGGGDYLSQQLLLSEKFESVRLQNGAMIENLFFYRNDGKIFRESASVLIKDVDYREREWFRRAVGNAGRIVWYETRQNDTYGNYRGKEVFSIVKEIRNANDVPLGVLMMNLKAGFLNRLLETLNLGKGNEIFIEDGGGNLIACSGDKGQYGKYAGLRAKVNFDAGETTEIGDVIAAYGDIELNGWKSIAFVQKDSFMSSRYVIPGSFILTAIIAVLLFALLSLGVTNEIVSPIKRLTSLMKRAGQGDLNVRVSFDGNDEIALLGNTFNNMLRNIDTLTKQMAEEREMKVNANLRALQSQINSHFLYNTLDSIYWLVKGGDTESAAQIVTELVSLMRLSLNKGNEMTTVENEIKHAESYMRIQKFRHEDISFNVFSEPELYGIEIPKLILQPLVENSILHGFKEQNYVGAVTIRIFAEDGRLCIEVEDDGAGMDGAEMNGRIKGFGFAAPATGGFGIFNVYTRIKMRYGDGAALEFFSVLGKGTRARVTLPVTLISNQFIDKVLPEE
jgi:two-component system sensor histidine kinase YesM